MKAAVVTPQHQKLCARTGNWQPNMKWDGIERERPQPKLY